MKFCSALLLVLSSSNSLASATDNNNNNNNNNPNTSEILRMPADSEYVGGADAYKRFAEHAKAFRDHAKKHLQDEYDKMQHLSGEQLDEAKRKVRGTLLDLDTYKDDAAHDVAKKFHDLAKLGASSSSSTTTTAGKEGDGIDSYSGDPISSSGSDDDDPSLSNYEHDSWSDFIPPQLLTFDVPSHASALKSLLPSSFTWRSHPSLGNLCTKNLNQHIPQVRRSFQEF